MSGPKAPSSFPRDPTVITLEDIKERLNVSQRLFSFEELEPHSEGGEWQETKSKRRPNTTRRRGTSKRTTYFSDNRALVKGIYVVAMGLRCAYLVDTITIEKNQVEVLGNYFRSITIYQAIAFLFEETTEQVYIVNLPLLRARSEGLETRNRTTTLDDADMLWLQVDRDKPCVPCEMRQSLKAQIDKQIAEEWEILPARPSEDSREEVPGSYIVMTIEPKDLPALSAWILEYPVGYTFSEDLTVPKDQTSPQRGNTRVRTWSGEKTNLDGEPLVLVKVKISGNKELGDNYDLLAFSYPAKLLDTPEEAEPSAEPSQASPHAVQQFLQHLPVRLKERYESRLRTGEENVRPEIDVTTERVRLEKVVL